MSDDKVLDEMIKARQERWEQLPPATPPVPEAILSAAHQILGMEEANDYLDQAEGGIIAVDVENYVSLLQMASNLARWIIDSTTNR